MIAREKLEKLMSLARAADERAASEKSAAAAKLKASQEADGLDLWAFRQAKILSRLDSGSQTIRLGNLHAYCDLLEIGTQMSFDEAMEAQDQRTAVEKVMDGELDTQQDLEDEPTASAEPRPPPEARKHSLAEVRILGRFTKALADADSHTAVELGLERFINDHPGLAEEGRGLARQRLAALSQEPMVPRRRRRNNGSSASTAA
jgi:hypothetical protein